MNLKLKYLAGFIVIIATIVLIAWQLSVPTKPSQPKRVVFITIDTLRADHLATYGYPRITSPFFDELAQKGVLFTNAYSVSSHTAPSHASMFTALFPYQHGLLVNSQKLAPQHYTISQMFKEHGYESVAFPAVQFMKGKVGFDTGGFKLKVDETNRNRKIWYHNASYIIDNAIKWLEDKSHKDPFFMWVHFYDVHQWKWVHDLPKQYLEQTTESYSEALGEFLEKEHNLPASAYKKLKRYKRAINVYDARIAYVDNEIKRLYKHMKNQGLNDNTLWVLTSDHGEGLGNHNYRGHGKYLYKEQLHVPLLFHNSSDNWKQKRRPELVTTVDLFPTLAEYLDFPLKERSPDIQGQSLLALLNSGEQNTTALAFSQRRPKDQTPLRKSWHDGEVYGLQSLKKKYILYTEAQDEYYDLEADPFEVNNLFGQGRPEEKDLRDKLERMIAAMPAKNSSEQIEIDPEALQELEALGYM